jgi:hypothetical protein
MAHVQIPAKEDVNQFPFHHSGKSDPQIRLTGDGCEVEKVNANDFIIRVPTASFDAFQNITDLSPVWDAVHDLEKHVKWATEHSDYNIQDSLSRGKLNAGQIERLASAVTNLEARLNIESANLAAARELARYALYGVAFSTTLSVAAGIALWILKA